MTLKAASAAPPFGGAKTWWMEDPNPASPPEDILPVSSRAESLLARSKGKEDLTTSFLRIAGAVEMMHGLDYHLEIFMQLIQRLQQLTWGSKGAHIAERNLGHEAVAYVNRIGQFLRFAKSKWVAGRLSNPLQLIPKISELAIFRDKHGAHRSIDWPLKEDTPHLQQVHAGSMTALGGRLFQPKEPCFSIDPRVMYQKCYRGFQLNMGAKGFWNLFLERDHPVVVNEAYALLEALLK